MIYKTTSVKKVIAKVFADLDLQEGNQRISDLISWAGEGLEKIGAFPWFDVMVAGKDDEPFIALSNFQAKLPCGFHKLIQVAYSTTTTGPFYPMRTGTGSFDAKRVLTGDTNDYSSTATGTADITPQTTVITLAMQLYNLTYSAALSYLNSNPTTYELLSSIASQIDGSNTLTEGDTNFTTDLTYTIQGNWIRTNASVGYLMMSYLAIPTDGEGYPLVPDDPGFLEAIYWYINMKLTYPMWRSGQIRDAIYMDAKRSWNFYCRQAYGNAMMPSGDELESIKNSWVRLVDNYTEHDSFFSTLGEREINWNS